MHLREVISLLRRGWPMLVVLVLLGAAASASYTFVQKTEYQSTAAAFVSTQSASSALDLNQGSTYLQQIVKSYASVATTPLVLDPVIRQLGLSENAAALSQQVTATAPLDEVVLQITVTDRSPSRAADIANAVTKQLGSAVQTLSPNSTDGTGAGVKITQIQPATVPISPVSPNLVANLASGSILGLVIGVIILFLRDRLDTRLRSPEAIHSTLGAPLLGAIPFDDTLRDRHILRDGDEYGTHVEAFRTLRTNLQFIDVEKNLRSIIVTSSIPSEGKSTTAANLAITIATTGRSVLLVDADLRRPQIAAYLGIEGSVGLTDVLTGSILLSEAIQSWGAAGLRVLASGPIPPNPSELLESMAMRALIADLESEYDLVIFDVPPLLPVADASILASATGGALLAAAAGRVRRAELLLAGENVRRGGGRLLGAIATMVPRRGPDAYAYDTYAYSYSKS